MKKPEILIVDDEPINLAALSNLLKDLYSIRISKSGESALLTLGQSIKPALILLDIMMPGLNGFETLAQIKANPETRDIPVIFISALDSDLDEGHGFLLGAVDYITKPFRPEIVKARVNTHFELKMARDHLKNQNAWLEAEVDRRVKENQLISEVFLMTLTQLAETRDENTGNHIVRTRNYIEILARNLQKRHLYPAELTDHKIDVMLKASPLHDIGKIGIPDAILLKPGLLTAEEFEVIKKHCQIGASTLRNAIGKAMAAMPDLSENVTATSLEVLETAEMIAKFHHEKWNGTGYPTGISGKWIPLPARLMALADVFDALTTSRPYKKSWPFQTAVEQIQTQSGQHFDPEIVEAFLQEQVAFESTLKALADQ